MLCCKKIFCVATQGLCFTIIITLLYANAYGIDNETKFNQLPMDRGKNIFAQNDINKFWFRNKGEHGNMSHVMVDSMPFTSAIEIKTNSAPPYSNYIRLSLDTPGKLKQNDLILVSFYARTTKPNKNGVGLIGFNLQRSSKPWTVYINWPLEIGMQWKRYYIPFSVSVRRGVGTEIIPPIPPGGDKLTFAAGEVRFGFKFGYQPQVIQLAGLKGINFGQSLPGEKLPYTQIKKTSDAIILSKELSDLKSQKKSWIPSILKSAKGRRKYLHDFSYAGYHFGEDSLPIHNTGWKRINVTEFGAIADDQIDDTYAIRKAIKQADSIKVPVVIEFPKGIFNIKEILILKRNNLIMRGAGSGVNGTVLKIMRPMKEMSEPKLISELKQEIRENDMRTDEGDFYSPFSWTGGVIWFDAPTEILAEPLTEITSVTQRGDHTVTVQSALFLYIGQVVQVRWYDLGGGDPIIPHIFNSEINSLPNGFRNKWPSAPQVWQNLTIQAIKGRKVTFKEPINHDIRNKWKPQIRKVGFVSEVGFDGFTIEFPSSVYAGRHREDGYNAIYINKALHSWVRDVKIVNCDSGIIVDNSKNITVKSVKIIGRGGHYSLMARNSDQVLFRDFEISTDTILYPSLNKNCRTTVFTHGKVDGAQLDQHNGMNHLNLWDNIEISGVLGNLWGHGGSVQDKPAHAAFNVSWNLRFNPQQNVPIRVNDVTNGPSTYFIGLTSNAPLMFKYGPNAYIEGSNQPNIATPSLYDYQLNRRIINKGPKVKPLANINPEGTNPLEVYFFCDIADSVESNIIAYQWKLGTMTKPNGALISSEKTFHCTFYPSKTYHVWLRVKEDRNWGDWGRVMINFKD